VKVKWDLPLAKFREAVENAMCAQQFVVEKAKDYGGDSQRVIWTGYSARGWLATMVSLGEGDVQNILDDYAAAIGGPSTRVECITEAVEPVSITGLVFSSGIYEGDFWLANDVVPWWTPVYEPLREYAAIGKNPDIKVRLIHGTSDRDARTAFVNAEIFAPALEDSGYDVVFLPQTNGHSAYDEQVMEEILKFENN
jgi:acetyl esterase/lipase